MKWFQGQQILVPFDYSDASVEAVKVALALADNADEVHVLHVLIHLPATEPTLLLHEFQDEKRAEMARESMKDRLSKESIDGVQIHVTLGNPPTVIADLAEEIDAGLIVIPSHGYTGLKRFMLGSVTERVVRLAKCPVLVLKQDET